MKNKNKINSKRSFIYFIKKEQIHLVFTLVTIKCLERTELIRAIL